MSDCDCEVCEVATELATERAERDRLRDTIEEYLLWEPGRNGHAEAHRRLAAALKEQRA